MRSSTNTNPVANGNRAAYAWAEADPRAVVLVAASDDGQAALGRAADAFTDAGLNDKARRVARVASMARTAGRMGALAAEIAPTLATLAPTFAPTLTPTFAPTLTAGLIELSAEIELGGAQLNAELAVGVNEGVNAKLAEELNEKLALEVIHALQTTEAGGGWTALAVVHRLQPKPANLKRSDPILPRITVGAVNPARERGELLLAVDGRPGLRPSALPLFPEVADDNVIVPLLEVADAATGNLAVSGGHGAAHELRLMFEALTALPPGGYAGGVPVAYTVGELMEAFYRGGTASMYRSGDRPGDWAQIRAACEWIDQAALPWRVPSGNMQSWFLMRLRTLPGERPARSDPVVFEVALPPGSGHGPAVNRPALREAGRVSSPAFRIGLAVPTLTWLPGVTRWPIKTRRGEWVKGPGGLWIGDASRYPVLSLRDRRRIAFGRDATHSPARVDAAWWKAADAAGVVILDTEAVERSGKRGWRVVPAAVAKAIRAAREKGR